MKQRIYILSLTVLFLTLYLFIFISNGITSFSYNTLGDDSNHLITISRHIEMDEEPLIINETMKITEDLIIRTSVKGEGKIITEKGARVIIIGNNLSVSGITIDGQESGKGIYFSYSTNCTIYNVKVENVSGGGITFQSCDNSKIISCITNNTRGKFGDGIIALNSKNTVIENNVCSNFQRAGIVVDWSGESKSENPIIKNNYCVNAIPAIDNQLNAGIWVENSKGGAIQRNTVENTLQKGIVITPNIEKETYEYNVNDNTIINSNEGINFVYSTNQILYESNNQFIDVDKIYEIGDCNKAILKNSNYKYDKKNIQNFNSILRFCPLQNTKTELKIENCNNYINGNETPIIVWNQYGMKADITIINCTGNFRISINENSLYGNILIDNCMLDYTKGLKANYFCNNTGTFFIRNSKIILEENNDFRVQANKVVFEDCTVNSISGVCRLYIGEYGSKNIHLINSNFNNAFFSDIVHSNTSINVNNINASGFPEEGFIISKTKIKELIVINSEFYSSKFDNAIKIDAFKKTTLNNKVNN